MEIRGIDFSGGHAPGEDIWIAEGRFDGDRLSVERCRSASDRFERSGREPILRALRRLLGEADGTTGLDFSFGLPAELLPAGIDDWAAAVAWFAETFADEDPDGMRERLKSAARERPGEGVELKRRTDRTVGANSPYSFITYYQTLYGLRDVLAPLVASGAISVPPFDAAGPRNAIEIYPAGTLRRLETVDTTYKDDTGDAAERRRRIVERLVATDDPSVDIPASVRETAIEESGGDALDSLVAAVATARAVGREFEPERPFDERDGHIYI